MDKQIKTQLLELKRFDLQRKAWMILSAFVMTVMVFVVFDHKDLIEYGLLWQIGILAIVMSAIWWYWSMRLISQLIQHRIAELEVIDDLHKTLVIVKKEFLETSSNDVD
jgi:Zn-dependent protease with chaperone function